MRIQFAHTAPDHVEALFSLVGAVSGGVALGVSVPVKHIVYSQRSRAGSLAKFTGYVQRHFPDHAAPALPEGKDTGKLEGLHGR